MVMTDDETLDVPAQSQVGSASADPEWLPRWELIVLAIGDLIALVIFAIIGRASHEELSTQAPLLAVLNTAAPFMLSWLLVGMVLGMYRGKALYPLTRVIWRTLLAGIVAAPLGVVFRALWLGTQVVWVFMAVATVFSTLALLVWRVIWSRVRRWWWPELP
jgi:hypothetical protein